MSDPAHYRVASRWVTMLTASRCVHHTSLADKCDACALRPDITELSDGLLMAEVERRGLLGVQVPIPPAPVEMPPVETHVEPVETPRPKARGRK